MNFRFLSWASVLVISMVMMGLSIRILALQEIPLSDSLIMRGGCCLFFVILFAIKQGLTLWPKSVKIQLCRALLAGLALTLYTLSYNWLTASAVSVLSNIDVPLLVLIGPFVGISASWRVRVFSLLSISFLAWYVLGLETQVNLYYGLSSLMIACLLLCFGYLFIKKSMNEENWAITILVPSLAIIFYGFMQRLVIDTPAFSWTFEFVFIGVLSGLGMFSAYIATMKLYALADLATAEFPTLIASLVIQPFEMILLGVPLQAEYVLSSLGFVVITYYILTWQKEVTLAS